MGADEGCTGPGTILIEETYMSGKRKTSNGQGAGEERCSKAGVDGKQADECPGAEGKDEKEYEEDEDGSLPWLDVQQADASSVRVKVRGSDTVGDLKAKAARKNGLEFQQWLVISEEGRAGVEAGAEETAMPLVDSATAAQCGLAQGGLVLCMAACIRDRFDRIRSANEHGMNGDTGRDLISADGYKAAGISDRNPLMGTVKVASDRHKWVVRVEHGDMRIGLVGDDVRTDVRWGENCQCWGIKVNYRSMWFAGQEVQRVDGPGCFTTPCNVMVALDCDAGTMGIGVEGQMPLTVLCRSIPKNEPMRFGCCNGCYVCVTTMLSYELI
jgi:hypothetical protein